MSPTTSGARWDPQILRPFPEIQLAREASGTPESSDLFPVAGFVNEVGGDDGIRPKTLEGDREWTHVLWEKKVDFL